jgi:sec-independent protein translocase protein TatB
MFGVGTGEILVILVIAMLVVGPERMVVFARQLGEWIAKFRQETDSVTAEFREALSLDLEESESVAAPVAQAGSEQESGESATAAARAAPEVLAAQSTGSMTDQRREVASPFADSELGGTPWPADEASAAPSDASDTNGEAIALEVAQIGANGDDLEPTLIQEPQVIVDEGEPKEVGSDGEEKG